MTNGMKDFVANQTRAMSDQARKLRTRPVQVARDAALRSARRIKSLKDPVRALSRSGVKLTAISHGTAQSLIELQEQIVTSALTDAAERLERAAHTENVMALVRDQGEVLQAARERIVNDIVQAVAIFRDAGGDVRKVATQTYAKVAATGKRKPAVAKAKRVPRAKRVSSAKRTAGKTPVRRRTTAR